MRKNNKQAVRELRETTQRIDNETRVIRHMGIAAETARAGSTAHIFIVGTNGESVGAHADWAALDGPSRADRFIQGDHAAPVFA